MPDQSEMTRILQALPNGRLEERVNSSERLFSLVYGELHKLAEDKLKREKAGQTLQPTALVHEVFLRLVSPDLHQKWDNTGHFFAAAAQAMRRILIENARKKNALKRGGNRQRIDLNVDHSSYSSDDQDLIDLNEALNQLATEDPIKARLVELRFFAGLSMEQTSTILGISRTTAHRHWNYARAWLFMRITSDANPKSLPK